MPIRATYDADQERLTLAFPNGETITGDATGRGDYHTVKLFDREVAARAIDPVFADAVRDLLDDETLVLLRAVEPEHAGSTQRIAIISRASVRDVGSRGGQDRLDPRRFRMPIEIEGCDPYEEDEWRGRRVRIGQAVVKLSTLMPRCVMTTLSPDTGRKDFPTLDVLAQHRNVDGELLLGVSGDVEEPGVVRLGDEVEPLSV
jgi:hypothetical protein